MSSRRRSGIMPKGKELDEYKTESEESYNPEEEEIERKKPKRKSEKTVTKKKAKDTKTTKKETKTKKTAKKATKKATKPKRETRKVVNHLKEDIEDESGDENPRRRKPKIHKSMKDFVDDHEETMEEEEMEDFESSEDEFNMHNVVDEEDVEDMEEMNEENQMEEEDMNDSSEFELYGVLEYNGSKNVEDEMMEEEENDEKEDGEKKEEKNEGEEGEEKAQRGKQKRTKEQRELINKHRETVIYLNGFEDKEKKEYHEKLHAMKIITTEKIEKATHLVEKTNVKNIKTIFALCKGIWILKEEYLKQIIANKNFVEEEPYENDELTSCKEQRENHKNIFENIKIYMTRFTPKDMTRTELNQLMNLTGFIPERNPRNTKIHIGCLEGEVSLQWVFDSILQNVILPFENYSI